MATVIKETQGRARQLPSELSRVLPADIYYAVSRLRDSGVAVDEVRLRTGKRASVTSDGRNIMLDAIIRREQMDMIVANICDGSLYAHADTIAKGYVTLDGGIRVGIVGRAAADGGRIIGVYDVSALCFRLPRTVRVFRSPVTRLIRENVGGVLVWSPPGVGKTTLLRSTVYELCGGEAPIRAAVIDTRGELSFSIGGEDIMADILSGYPRALGVEIATRCMNAELLVCDEIGDEAETEALIGALLCGVPLLASAHARNVEELLRRPSIKKLHRAGVFGAYVGIYRRNDGERVYTVTGCEEADRYLQNSGSDAHRF